MDEYKINLQKYIPNGSIILTDRNRRKELRKRLDLDRLENEQDKILVFIPESIVSFNSSFFLGLFTPSIKKCGSKEKFLGKFEFKCDKYIEEDINDGINEALKPSNIL